MLAFLLLIQVSCQKPQYAFVPGNTPFSKLQDEAVIERGLVFRELKEQNSSELLGLCKEIGGLIRYRYGRWMGEGNKSPLSYEEVLPYINSLDGLRVEGDIIQLEEDVIRHIDGHCELKLLEDGEKAALYGSNALYNNLVVVEIDGWRWDGINLNVSNLDDSQKGVYHVDPLIYQERLEAIASRVAERDSIFDNIFSDLLNYEDKEKQNRALGWLLSELNAAGTHTWFSGEYAYPSDLQKGLYKYQYVKINDRLASLIAGSDSLFHQLTKEPGEMRKSAVHLLGYLHPMTSSLDDGWEWPDEPVSTTMNISSIRRAVFRAVLESGDSNVADIVLRQLGFELVGMEQLIFPYLYMKGNVRRSALAALDRIVKPSDAVLDSLERYIKKRKAEPPIYNAIARHRSDRATLILIEDIFNGPSNLPGMRDVLLQALTYSDSAKVSKAVAEHYKTYCEEDRTYSLWRPVGGDIIEATGNRYLLLQDLLSENKCHQKLGLTYLNQIDQTYTAPLVLEIVNNEQIPVQVRRNLLVQITGDASRTQRYDYKYLEQHLPLPSFWVKQLEENGPFADLAIWRIGDTENKEFIPVVLNYIERDYAANFVDKRGAAYSLVQLGAREAGRYSMQVLQEADNDLDRKRLLGALINFEKSDSTIAPDIWHYLNEKQYRGYALNILGYSRHSGSVSRIVPYLDAEEEHIRSVAAFALCMIGTADAKAVLDEALNTSSIDEKIVLQKWLTRCAERTN